MHFCDATLPCLDELYHFARILSPSPTEAEEAVYACYRQAQQLFESRQGLPAKLWLLQILRTLCHAKLGPDGAGPQRQSAGADISPLAARLPLVLREIVALREFHDLGYREIAEVTGTSVAMVAMRLSQARRMMIAASPSPGLSPPGAPPSPR